MGAARAKPVGHVRTDHLLAATLRAVDELTTVGVRTRRVVGILFQGLCRHPAQRLHSDCVSNVGTPLERLRVLAKADGRPLTTLQVSY